MKKDIFIILPFKESLNPKLAGAVSYMLKIQANILNIKRIQVISSDNLSEKTKIFRNRNYIKNFCNKYSSHDIKIIEIHNRPEYLSYIKKFFPNAKINIIFHNDPLTIRGSIKKNEREKIITDCNKVIL